MGDENVPRSRIMVMTDEHGRLANYEFEHNLGLKNYEHLLVKKPAVPIETVLEHLEYLAYDFTKNDFVIICGGIVNAWGPLCLSVPRMKQVLYFLRSCNVIVVELPYRLSSPELNVTLLEYNTILRKLCLEGGAIYLESNPCVHQVINKQLILTETDEYAVFPKIMPLLRSCMQYMKPDLVFDDAQPDNNADNESDENNEDYVDNEGNGNIENNGNGENNDNIEDNANDNNESNGGNGDNGSIESNVNNENTRNNQGNGSGENSETNDNGNNANTN